jgi:hypothetical protein
MRVRNPSIDENGIARTRIEVCSVTAMHRNIRIGSKVPAGSAASSSRRPSLTEILHFDDMQQ